MARILRKISSKKIYHIMLRGNNRDSIFRDDEDKARMLQTLKYKKKAEGFLLYAYCILDNHLHLVLMDNDDQLSKIMKRIEVSYTHYFTRKYQYVGHVFQGRFRSECVEDERYLLTVIRYVHRNPIKAGIVKEMEAYPWSSYPEYMREISQSARYSSNPVNQIRISKAPARHSLTSVTLVTPVKITDTAEILGIFSQLPAVARVEFAKFNQQDDSTDNANSTDSTNSANSTDRAVSTYRRCLDIDEEKEIKHDTAEEYISAYLEERQLTQDDLRHKAFKPEREKLVRLLQNKSSLSNSEIARLLGLSRETVRVAGLKA